MKPRAANHVRESDAVLINKDVEMMVRSTRETQRNCPEEAFVGIKKLGVLSADIFPYIFVLESGLFVRIRHGNDGGRNLATGLFSIAGPVRSRIVLSSSDELL